MELLLIDRIDVVAVFDGEQNNGTGANA